MRAKQPPGRKKVVKFTSMQDAIEAARRWIETTQAIVDATQELPCWVVDRRKVAAFTRVRDEYELCIDFAVHWNGALPMDYDLAVLSAIAAEGEPTAVDKRVKAAQRRHEEVGMQIHGVLKVWLDPDDGDLRRAKLHGYTLPMPREEMMDQLLRRNTKGGANIAEKMAARFFNSYAKDKESRAQFEERFTAALKEVISKAKKWPIPSTTFARNLALTLKAQTPRGLQKKVSEQKRIRALSTVRR